MLIGERILLSLSRAPSNYDYQQQDSEMNIDTALDCLHRSYPNLKEYVTGKRVIDFGCGTGCQSIALVKKYNCLVVGIDTNKRTLNTAMNNANDYNIHPQQLSFVERTLPSMLNNFDVVISQNSFEHFLNPEKILNEMKELVGISGIILLTFGPPWFAPYGSHMHFFCKVPWINIFFSEKTIMKVRGCFRDDGAKKYEEVESGLNKMTVAKFESIVSSHSLKISYCKYSCIKGMNFLAKLPLLRELFINHVAVILCRTT